MKKVKLSVVMASIALLSAISHQASAVPVTVTASTVVSNVPSNTLEQAFMLMRPWDNGKEPTIAINATPSTANLDVDPRNTMPTLRLTNNLAPESGARWFYYCEGLQLNYAPTNNTATIVFSGTIDTGRPGTNVQCTCSGSACSTTQTVPTGLLIQ